MNRAAPRPTVRVAAAGPRRPIRGRSAQTRAAILAAAEDVFAAAGLAGARTDAIAAAAGVNKAMLYYYFRDKESLYEAVLEEHFRAFNTRSLAVLAAPGSARAVLLNYVGMHFDFIAAHRHNAPLFQQLMTAGGKPLERLVKRYFLPRTAALGKLLRRGMTDGEFRRADPVHTAITLAAVIVFYFSAARVLEVLGHRDAYSPANLRRRRQEVFDFIRHGLFRDPESPVKVL